MNYDRPSRSPRLILDENIDSSSLDTLLQCGLNQRCSQVYQSWCEEKRRNTELMEQHQRGFIDAELRKKVATMLRIKNGIMMWVARQAVARYPCV